MKKADTPQRYPPTKTRLFFAEGTWYYYDRAPVRGWYSPYAANRPSARTLSSIASGALPTPFSPDTVWESMQ